MFLMGLITVYSYVLDDLDFGVRLPAGKKDTRREKRPDRLWSHHLMSNGN
jgi:hypothetical protein